MALLTHDRAPVPGDPDTLEALARQCQRTSGGLRSDVAVLRGSRAVSGWHGRAASSFEGSVGGLPGDLVRAAESYEAVARALLSYSADLRDAQRLARRADAELAALTGRLSVEGRWLVGPVGEPGAEEARERRIAALHEEELAVRRQLAGIVDRASVSAGEATCRIRIASNAPESPPGLFERLLHSTGEWIDDHAELLEDISLVLQGISAVAGVLALVPVLSAFCTPIALAAGLAALAVDVALAARGKRSWTSVAVSAATTAMPAARPARAALSEVRTRLGSVVVYRVEGTPNTRVVIDADNNVRFQARSMLYLNFGDKRRAEEYYRRKMAAGLPGAQLKSFRVPKREFRALSARAVDQHMARAFPHGLPHRVDTTVARDQLGLWRADFRALEKHILPGSGKVLR